MMKFSLSAKTFTTALVQVGKTAPSKLVMPILGMVEIKVSGDRIRLRTTDLEITSIKEIRGNVDLDSAIIDEAGTTLVPYASILRILKALKDHVIECEVIPAVVRKEPDELDAPPSSPEKFRIKLDGADGEYFVSTGDPIDFPEMPEMDRIESRSLVKFGVPGEDLSAMGKVLLTSMSLDQMRPVLCGALVEPEFVVTVNKKPANTGIKFVATNGYRLARFTLTEHSKVKWTQRKTDIGSPKRVIPSNVFKFLTAQMLKKTTAVFTIGNTRGIIHLPEIDFWLEFRLIEGNYPKYDSVIPDLSSQPQKATFDTEKMLEVLDRSKAVANSMSRQVIATFQPDENQIVFKAENTESGSGGQETIKCHSMSGESLEIGWSVDYLISVIGNVKPGRIEGNFRTRNDAAIFIGESRIRGIDLMQLLMPIRLR